MKLMTIGEAARAVRKSAYTVRIRVESGEISYVRVGRRILVDVDEVRAFFARPTGLTVEDVSRLTGMSVNMVYRLIHGGWFKAVKVGNKYVMDAEQVKQAIRERMASHEVE